MKKYLFLISVFSGMMIMSACEGEITTREYREKVEKQKEENPMAIENGNTERITRFIDPQLRVACYNLNYGAAPETKNFSCVYIKDFSESYIREIASQ